MKRVAAAAAERSHCRGRRRGVVPGAADQRVVTVAAAQRVVAVPPSIVRCVSGASPLPAVIVSSPPRPCTTRFSTAVVSCGESPRRERRDRGPVVDDPDRVRGRGAAVGRGVVARAAVERDRGRAGDAHA